MQQKREKLEFEIFFQIRLIRRKQFIRIHDAELNLSGHENVFVEKLKNKSTKLKRKLFEIYSSSFFAICYCVL